VLLNTEADKTLAKFTPRNVVKQSAECMSHLWVCDRL